MTIALLLLLFRQIVRVYELSKPCEIATIFEQQSYVFMVAGLMLTLLKRKYFFLYFFSPKCGQNSAFIGLDENKWYLYAHATLSPLDKDNKLRLRDFNWEGDFEEIIYI